VWLLQEEVRWQDKGWLVWWRWRVPFDVDDVNVVVEVDGGVWLLMLLGTWHPVFEYRLGTFDGQSVGYWVLKVD
jgi:hypothetical protein